MQWTHGGDVPRVASMFAHAFPLVLTVAGGLLYHVAMKTQSGAAGPWAFFTLAYGVAFIASAVLWRLGGGGIVATLGRLDRSSLIAAGLLGVAAVGIEAGYFLAYRSGWALSQASAISSVALVVLLAVVGIAASGEVLTASRAAGLVIAVGGVSLVVHGG